MITTNTISTANKPRILMLTCQYPPDVYGGAEQQCKRISLALKRLGHDVQILTSRQRDAGKVDDAGLKVTRIYTFWAPDLLGRWFPFSLYWLVRVLLWGFFHRQTFDVIHCHQGKYGGFVGSALGGLLGKPVLIKVGNSGVELDPRCLRRKWLFGPLCDAAVRRLQPLMVAITKEIEDELAADEWARRIRIPNGISLELKPFSARRTNKSGIHLFYHGRVEPIKRVPLLVEAFAQLDCPEAQLHIYGDGHDMAQVRDAVQRLGLQHRVHLWGSQTDVLSHIAKLDVFVNASRSEGFSNSLLEALLCEKVLVSTPVSGAADAITDGVNGAIAPAESAAALAAAMGKAINIFRNSLELAQQDCRQKVMSRFAMHLVAQRYSALYTALAQNPLWSEEPLTPTPN